MVDRHNCQLLDDNGNKIPKYKYMCHHPKCRKKKRVVGNKTFTGIKPFHDAKQYTRHLESEHHRVYEYDKKSKLWVLKGFPNHILKENYLSCDGECQWWLQPNHCQCWKVHSKKENCKCKLCSARKYKKKNICVY